MVSKSLSRSVPCRLYDFQSAQHKSLRLSHQPKRLVFTRSSLLSEISLDQSLAISVSVPLCQGNRCAYMRSFLHESISYRAFSSRHSSNHSKQRPLASASTSNAPIQPSWDPPLSSSASPPSLYFPSASHLPSHHTPSTAKS